MDDETQRQLAELRDEIAAVARVREASKRRRYGLQEQAAKYGIDAPAQIVTEIRDLASAIAAADAQIREFQRLAVRLELAPPSALLLPDSAPYIPELIPALVDSRLREMDSAIAIIHDLLDLSREESREWRAAQRSMDRAFRIGGAVVLLILGIAVVVLLIQVF